MGKLKGDTPLPSPRMQIGRFMLVHTAQGRIGIKDCHSGEMGVFDVGEFEAAVTNFVQGECR